MFNQIHLLFAESNNEYQRPFSYEEIREKEKAGVYPEGTADRLMDDPVHKWRMETGIELIHKEPDEEEQIRIWDNWQKMSDEQKEKSDEKSIELYDMTNEEHHKQIMNEYWDK